MTKEDLEKYLVADESQYQKLLKAYLVENASDMLIEKILTNKNKNISDAFEYIKGEARKQAKNGCACIDDATVYGWLMHYFEEDDIKAQAVKEKATKKTEESSEADEVESSEDSEMEEEKPAVKKKTVKAAPKPKKEEKPKEEKPKEEKPKSSSGFEQMVLDLFS